MMPQMEMATVVPKIAIPEEKEMKMSKSVDKLVSTSKSPATDLVQNQELQKQQVLDLCLSGCR